MHKNHNIFLLIAYNGPISKWPAGVCVGFFFQYWDECLGDMEKVQPITAEVYIEYLMKLGLKKLKEHNRGIETLLFAIMDVNNDGFISPEEFKFWFKVSLKIQ